MARFDRIERERFSAGASKRALKYFAA